MKLAIVGGGNTMTKAPFEDEDFDIWTTPSISKNLPRVTTMFEFHDENAYQLPEVYLRGEVIYKKDFPIREIELKYGKIFPSSMNLILAYALELGYKHIVLYGVDEAQQTEYERFRPSLLYLIGYARGTGVVVEISEGSVLMPPEKTYCFEYDMKREKLDKINELLAKAEEQLRGYELITASLRGEKHAAELFAKL